MIYLASTVVLVWNSYSCVLPARVLYRPVSITVGSVIPCKRDNHGGNPWDSAQYDVLDSNLVKKYKQCAIEARKQNFGDLNFGTFWRHCLEVENDTVRK